MKTKNDLKPIMLLIISTIILFVFILKPNDNKRFEYPPLTTDIYFDISLPGYVPEEFTVSSFNADPLFCSVEYVFEDKYIYYTQINSTSLSVSFDTEYSTISEYHSERFDGYILIDDIVKPLNMIYVWDDNNIYKINGNIDLECINNMIESIELYYPAN